MLIIRSTKLMNEFMKIKNNEIFSLEKKKIKLKRKKRVQCTREINKPRRIVEILFNVNRYLHFIQCI